MVQIAIQKIKKENYVIHDASDGFLSVVQYLSGQQNINKDIKNKYKQTPLHYACEKGHHPIVEYLISKGSNVRIKLEN